MHLITTLEVGYALHAQYGPLSGRAYEERVITAYMNGLLEIKPEFEHLRGAEEMKVCYECGKPGHFPQDCLDRL